MKQIFGFQNNTPVRRKIQKLTPWAILTLINSFDIPNFLVTSVCSCKNGNRAVFEWLSKVMTRLRLFRLVIGLKISRLFFNQWEEKPKPIAPCSRDFSRALSKFHVVAMNSDWFISWFAAVVIGRNNYFGIGSLFMCIFFILILRYFTVTELITKLCF